MNDTAVIVVGLFGIVSELVGLRLIRRVASQLTMPLRVLIWAKRLSIISFLTSGVFSLIVTRLQSPLSVIFEAGVVAWVASTLGYWIILLAIPHKHITKSA